MSANNILKSEEEKAKHHGQGYQCLCCLSKGVQYVAEKILVEDHIMKMHLSLDEVPFYCSLCMFKCKTSTTLDNHLVRYRGLPSLPKKRRWTLPTVPTSGPTPIHTRFRTRTTGNWTGTIHGFTFFLGSRVISQPCFLRTSWMPQCWRAKSLKWNQVPPVLSTPAIDSNKEQLCDLFQDFIRKQAPLPATVPLQAPVPLPAPVPFPALAPWMITTGPPPSTLESLEVAQKPLLILQIR